MKVKIQPIMSGTHFFFSFDEGKTGYPQYKQCVDAHGKLFKGGDYEYELMDINPYTLTRIEKVLCYYDVIYRKGKTGRETTMNILRNMLNIPAYFPSTLEDKDYDVIFNGLKEILPTHWFFNVVAVDKQLLKERFGL